MQHSGSSRAIGKKPSVVRKRISIGTIGNINIAIQKQESRALQMLFRDKWHAAVDGESGIGSRNRTLNLYWSAKLLRPAGEAESVQPMNNASVFAGGNSHIQRAGRGINNWCAADTDLRC